MLSLLLLGLSTVLLPRLEAQAGPRSDLRAIYEFQGANLPCSQSVAEQAALIRKAQTNKYTVRRLEFIGNERIRDGVLRRRILLQEGEFFTRGILIKSLINVSKLKLIYPVRLRDVIVKLDYQEKTVDVVICFKERTQSAGRKTHSPDRPTTLATGEFNLSPLRPMSGEAANNDLLHFRVESATHRFGTSLVIIQA